jgi:hypothetical protein
VLESDAGGRHLHRRRQVRAAFQTRNEGEPSLRAIYTSDRELQNIVCVQLFEKEKLEVEIREEIVNNPFPCFDLHLYF